MLRSLKQDIHRYGVASPRFLRRKLCFPRYHHIPTVGYLAVLDYSYS